MSTKSTIGQSVPITSTRGAPQLEPDFAMRMIEKEVELEKYYKSETIHQLVLLYSQIIEYYEYYKDPKYYDFQDRMHKMLVRPQVIQAMQDENQKSRPRNHRRSISSDPVKHEKTNEQKIIERKKEAEKQKSQLNVELNKTIGTTSHKQVRNVNRIINLHETSTKQIAHKAQGDFMSQDADLERRLASRRKVMTDRSMESLNYSPPYSPGLQANNESTYSDIDEQEEYEVKRRPIFHSKTMVVENEPENGDESGGLGVSMSFMMMGDIEDQLEELMEKSFSDKASKIAEIKVRYETQIRELEGQGGLMNMIIDQMKENMKQEIENLTQELDTKRRQEIRVLKEKFQLK